MNYLVSVCLLLFLTACGVSTDSSKNSSTQGGSTIVDVNSSVDINSSVDTNSSTDINSSTGDINSLFDETDALYDSDACGTSAFNKFPITDNSRTGTEAFDSDNGISIKSYYRETGVDADSSVILFYNALPSGTTLLGSTTTYYGDNGTFYVSYDLIWMSVESNRVYVQLPQGSDEKPTCLKLVLDKEIGTSIEAQKVYR